MQETPPPQQDTYTLVVEAVVGAVLVYFCWQPAYEIVRPIVHSLFAPVWQALG